MFDSSQLALESLWQKNEEQKNYRTFHEDSKYVLKSLIQPMVSPQNCVLKRAFFSKWKTYFLKCSYIIFLMNKITQKWEYPCEDI